MTKPTFRFHDDLAVLPTGTHSRGKHDEFFDALRRNPMKWAEFPRQGSRTARKSAAGNIRLGVFAGTTKGEFEATNHDGVLYARYVGEQ